MRQGELEGMPEPAALRLLATDGQVLVTHGRTLVYRYEADDTGMRNLAIAALNDDSPHSPPPGNPGRRHTAPSRPPSAPRLSSSPVHSHAPRRPFGGGQDRRKGRRLLPDILTLASHTTAGKDGPGPPANAHYRLTTTPSSSPWVAVNRRADRLAGIPVWATLGHWRGRA